MNDPKFAFLTGPIGHLSDLAAMAQMKFRNPRSYTKYRHIKSTAKRVNAKTLIETGTFRGVTTLRCAPHFEKIFTIELSEELALESSERLKKFDHCTVIQGDATAKVSELLESGQLGDDLLFFLDGHFSGGVTALGDHPEPALEILDIIAKHSNQVGGIIIDDFREFGTQPGWPKKSELLSRAEDLFCDQGFDLTVQMDQLTIARSPS